MSRHVVFVFVLFVAAEVNAETVELLECSETTIQDVSIKTFYRTVLKLGYRAEGGNNLPANPNEPCGAFYNIQIAKWRAYKKALKTKQESEKHRSRDHPDSRASRERARIGTPSTTAPLGHIL